MTLLVHFETECGPLEYALADSKDKFGSGEFSLQSSIFSVFLLFPIRKGCGPFS